MEEHKSPTKPTFDDPRSIDALGLTTSWISPNFQHTKLISILTVLGIMWITIKGSCVTAAADRHQHENYLFN